jgi:HK97 family phage prohead protease
MDKKRYAKALVKKVSDKDGMLSSVIGSDATVDRYGEIIDQTTWDLKSFKKNPVILWAHNLTMGEDRPPIGKAVNVEVKAGKLLFDIQFDMKDPFAADIWRKYKEKFLNAFSVGFISHKVELADGNEPPILKDNELLELSAVPVPANPAALQSLRAKSFAPRDFKTMVDEVEEENKKHVKVKKQKKSAINKDTDIVLDKSEKQIEKGEKKHDSPESPQLGSNARLIAVLREATHQFQQILSEENAARRSERKTQ